VANIGDTVSFTASKYKNLFVSDDKRYTIAYFTVNARDARLYLPQDAKTKQYGTTHMPIFQFPLARKALLLSFAPTVRALEM